MARSPSSLLTALLGFSALALSSASGSEPSLLADINPFGGDGQVQMLFNVNGELVFGANKCDGPSGSANVELRAYHPTSGIRDLTTTMTSSFGGDEAYVCEFNGKVYFSASIPSLGMELAYLDSSEEGFTMVSDLVPGYAGSFPRHLTVFGDAMYFNARRDNSEGVELFKLTASNEISLAYEFNSANYRGGDPKFLAEFRGKLYMQAASDDSLVGVELFAFDGTDASLAADVCSSAYCSSKPAFLTVFNDTLYMSALGDASTGRELWAFDGTSASLVVDIVPGSGSSDPRGLTVFSGSLFFGATTPATGTELFRLDGTSAVLVAELVPGPDGADLGTMAQLEGVLYMSRHTDALGWELHRLSSTGTAIELVIDLCPTPLESSPRFFTLHDGDFYFAADDGVHDEKLWRYSSEHGAQLASTLSSPTGNAFITGIGSYNGSVVLGTFVTSYNIEMAKFDPQTEQFGLLADINPGSSRASVPSWFCVMDGVLYFSATGESGLVQLWSFTPEAT
ncbi:hypothetical protein FNF27_06230 [Cafeteria roenbergensis]|uniref:Uncharacterized protein n=1 Tax=Cafeteria roenbergensis TaxID=33653 RepID=A0A5A8E1Q8_CAFRO|nr:hypothetical protein FNF27_06230 [Cafeteria roenbergensis]